MSQSREKISVALCTYNGAQFLEQQLTSIAQQTRLPDQLLVSDDGSTDQTVAMVRAFAASAAFPVVLIENPKTLGSAKNFEQALRLCDGDLIALSDQDDIWYPNRLQRSEQEFDAYPNAGLVFSDAHVIDEHNRVQAKTLWQRLGFAGQRRTALLSGQFVLLAKHRFITGATVMVRAGLRDRVLPIAPGWIHDEWIALITAAYADLRPIDQPLIRYRIHSSQQVGLHNKLQQRTNSHWSRLTESAQELEQLCAALSAMPVEPNPLCPRGLSPAPAVSILPCRPSAATKGTPGASAGPRCGIP